MVNDISNNVHGSLNSSRMMRFLIILPFSCLLHICLSMILLKLHIASRIPYIIGDSAIAIAFLAIVLIFSAIRGSKMSLGGQKNRIDWKRISAGISVALCIVLLWSARFDYSGPAYDGVLISETSHESVMLPVFSDEWLYAGFAHKAAELARLPTFNPLTDAGESTPIFLAPYISALAGLSQSTGIDIVREYGIYVWLFQLLFALIFYALLRSFNLSALASVLGLSLLLFLPESNLAPGIWIMLPAYVGFIFMMAAFVLIRYADDDAFDEKNEKKNAMPRIGRNIGIVANLILASIIYPSYLAILAIYVVFSTMRQPKLLAAAIIGISSVGFACFWLAGALPSTGTISDMAERTFQMVMRPRVGAATESIWRFIPIVFYLTSMIGLYMALVGKKLGLIRKRIFLFGFVFLAIIIESAYLFDREIIITHQRAVFVCWIFMIAATCTFLDVIGMSLQKKLTIKRDGKTSRIYPKETFLIWIIIVIQSCILISGTYSLIPPWRGVTANVDVLIGPVFSRPIMLSMLHEGYQSEIKRITESKAHFLADPYMSLAIGATTDLIPISAVPSFISITGPTLADFYKSKTCSEKADFAVINHARYVIVHIGQDILRPCEEFRFEYDFGSYMLYENMIL